MAGHAWFTKSFERDGVEWWKFMTSEDGENCLRFITITRNVAEAFRDALTVTLRQNDRANPDA